MSKCGKIIFIYSREMKRLERENKLVTPKVVEVVDVYENYSLSFSIYTQKQMRELSR